ncbi:type II secretion system protein [Peptoniphilus sp. HMSC075B08]|uniref:type II secretion system protein n=1 Tax=Peptoniphilus sp. HMSC075B08 TaxID=1739525 RepID=UPI001FEF8549|nr:type II secretion system protein [Peptoniphilus sp. HMSC075B08]
MIIKNKHKGHLMLEVLFSIALLALIASTILPNVLSLLKNQTYIGEREELISLMSSRMEEIIGSSYNNEDLDFHFDDADGFNDKFKIEVEKESEDKLDHIILRGKRRGSDEEIKMEVYLKKGGLFTD